MPESISTQLESDTIAIEFVELPQIDSDTDLGWHRLSPAEQSRADAITHRETRSMYIFSKCLVRERLSEFTHIEPQAVVFMTNPHDKPYLARLSSQPSTTSSGSTVFFNISHSKRKLAMAFSRQCEVGIDIQYHNSRCNARELATRFFAPPEIDFLDHCPNTDLLQHFYHIWARKEAVIKAVGKGLQLPLDSFSVCSTTGESYSAIKLDNDLHTHTQLRLCSISLPFPDFSAAVAWEEAREH